jgi:transposase InsO family protein
MLRIRLKLSQGAGSKKRHAAMIAVAREFGGALPKSTLASILEISRSSLYRSDEIDRDVDLRDAIYAITIDWPRYGYRTVTLELRRQGWVVNEKRVRRIMLAEGLQCRRRAGRGFRIARTPRPHSESRREPEANGG